MNAAAPGALTHARLWRLRPGHQTLHLTHRRPARKACWARVCGPPPPHHERPSPGSARTIRDLSPGLDHRRLLRPGPPARWRAPASQGGQTAFIERLNLTVRRSLASTCPPEVGDGQALLEHGPLDRRSGPAIRLVACRFAYHFVKPHHSLRQKIETPNGRLRYRSRTPAQAAGLTRRRWSVLELLNYPPSAALAGRLDNEILPRKSLTPASGWPPLSYLNCPHSGPVGFPELPTTSKFITRQLRPRSRSRITAIRHPGRPTQAPSPSRWTGYLGQAQASRARRTIGRLAAGTLQRGRKRAA